MNPIKRTTSPEPPKLTELISAAKGHWSKILSDAGIPQHMLDGKPHSCPLCGGWDRFRALPEFNQTGQVHCDRCFQTDTIENYDGIATLQWISHAHFDLACDWLAAQLAFTSPDEEPSSLKELGRAIRRVTSRFRSSAPKNKEIAEISLDFQAAVTSERVCEFSRHLGLPGSALMRMRVGWSRLHNAITFPIEDRWRRTVGIQLLSLEDGRRWSMRGGTSRGMFAPSDMTTPVSRVYFTNGPIATTALLSMGLPAIGFTDFNCDLEDTGFRLLKLHPMESVIIADRDSADGVEELKHELMGYCRSVRIVAPPTDLPTVDGWLMSGITKAGIEEAVSQANEQSLR